ncbi:sugar ABC transporter permease [Pseudonocardia sp. RS11V-5]|uniref:carbohydrate ABC transporter permease n=1 Tax=Pseudonocardia terrae TaxID=2905831 RepID=UPI001E2E23DB|nr:sugar ABC transporter permease [Pseudonocardia terrae]MCE3551393.1 sugar ABC transporter permease [Pseudonocardia terrae]
MTVAQVAAPARRPARRAGGFGLALVAPTVLLLLLVQAYPLVEGLRLSFTQTALARPRAGSYVGLDNYAELLADPRLGKILWVTLVYTVASVLGSLVLGLVAAMVMNVGIRGRGLLRAILTVPWAAPGVATALVFIWMLDSQYGITNWALTRLPFVDSYQRWLNDPALAMPAVVAVTIWKVFPFAAIALLAALQAIPGELYEAAKVDRATALNRFRQVTMPGIAPTVLTLALFLTIWSFRRFELIWLLTGGGPVDATNTLMIDLYRESFRNRQLGYGSAIGVVGLVLSVAAAVVYFVVSRRLGRRYGGAG